MSCVEAADVVVVRTSVPFIEWPYFD